MERFEIGDILRRAFGLAGVTFFYPPVPTKDENGSGFIPGEPEVPFAPEVGFLGKAIISPTYLTVGDITVMLDGVCTFSMEKNIVKTALAGRDKSVKEYISAGDYSVSVQALLVSSSKYQKPDVANLRAILESNTPVSVAGAAWRAFGLYSVVIESFRFAEVGGSPNMLPIEIQCIEDTPVELEFLEK